MKAGTVAKMALVLLIAAGATYAVKPELFKDIIPGTGEVVSDKKAYPKSALPKEVQAAIATADYTKVQESILAALKGKNILPDTPEVLEMAMLLEVIRETDAKVMTEFAGKSKLRRKFLAEFAKDAAWQELYLGCGLVPHSTDVGLDVLYRIWKDRKGNVENKPLAVALASAWGGGETDPKPREKTQNPNKFNPVWRYNFFVKNAAKGVLHPNFGKLKAWELRFVTGNPWQDWDDLSFEWALENINVPWDKFHTSCWAATYTDPSKFGDTVQGGMYNLPYSDQSQAEACHRNGGVCGAMSHLGCVAAQAHGIPAYTVGQPGHCAYAVRPERGTWIGGFGGPDGGMHNRIFGNQAPTSYLLMETVFGNDENVEKAYRHAVCARALEATGDTAGAIDMWQKALQLSPLHPFFRTALSKQMKSQGLTPDKAYSYLSKTIPLYEGNGFAAVNMMQDLEEEINAMSDEQKIKLYALCHKMISGTPSSWAVTCKSIIQKQSDTLSTLAAQEKYLGTALAIHMNAKDATTFGQLLEWALKNYVEKGKEDVFGRAFNTAAAQAESNSGSGDAKAEEERLKKLGEAYNKAIVAAEEARSAAAFVALTQAASKVCGPCNINIPLKSTVPGKPIEAAMFRSSSTSQWDTPRFHANITTPKGGKCHTGKEATPNFVVELPKRRFVSGCIIRKTDGNEGRMKKATVYTSEDGATWVARESTEQMPKEWAISFPEGTPAKWLKVEFDNSKGNDYAHISHFVVYGK